ncbi:MAG: GNAT family N-acetyltransferase [Candidatus Lokiarchaeota archaeon]|nr:GNAT family N-acetyltransferase [Candidatus Lokiarchaeota archaeon]
MSVIKTILIEDRIDRKQYISLFKKHINNRAILFQGLRLEIGHLFVDSINNPTTGIFSLDPVHFVAGNPDTSTAIEFLRKVQPLQFVFIPTEKWSKQISTIWGERTIPHKRTRLDETSLSLDHLRKLREELPSGFNIGPIQNRHLDEIPSGYLDSIEKLFGSRKNFLKDKFGKSITFKEELASIAYPAFPYINEFEIQVITLNKKDFRQKGLATVACAEMIIDALEHNIVPHWDAANEPSIALAKKLGYSNPVSYYAYFKAPNSE